MFQLISGLCLGVILMTSHANAESTPFEMAGSVRVRAESKTNADFLESAADDTHFTASRFRFDMKWKPKEEVTVLFQPQFSKVWGDQKIVPATATTNQTLDTSGAVNDTGLDIHQAYLRLRVLETAFLTLGRKELNYGDQLLLGGVGWSNVGRSFDAGLLTAELPAGSIDLILAKVRETSAQGVDKGDKDLSGLYWNHRLSESVQHLDVYALLSQDHPGDSSTTATGLRLKSPIGAFDYRLEYTSQTVRSGSNSVSAAQSDMEIGYRPMESSKLRVAAEHFRADANFDQLYPTGHKWLGYADLFSRRNIGGTRFGLSGSVSASWDFELSYHDFRRVDSSAPAYKFSGSTYGASGTDEAIATEIDVILKTRLPGETALEFGFARCSPGGYLKENGAEDPTQFAYASVLVDF